MTTFAQTSDGDIQLTLGKTTLVSGAQAGAVKLYNRLRLFKGSWFRDTRQGIPYFQSLFGVKNPDLNVARQIFLNVIRQTPGVKSADVKVSLDAPNRVLNVSFTALWDDGATITATSLDQPFLVNVPQQSNGVAQ